MADHIHIEGLPPYDGDWPLDVSRFTNRELHIIKQIAGVRANELDAAFEAGDNDLVVAFTEIALTRAGLKVDRERLWEADVGAVTLVVGDEPEQEEGEGVPPASAPPTERNATGNGSATTPASGVSSTPGGVPPASLLSRTGTPA